MTGVLGTKVAAPQQYAPDILERIDRHSGREGIDNASGYVSSGHDIWHCYELSWLLPGENVSYLVGALTIPASSAYTVESKSLKLYLNSLNAHEFVSDEAAVSCVEADLSALTGAKVTLTTTDPSALNLSTVPLSDVQITPRDTKGTEIYRCSGFRSLCPVTAQPDWASLCIEMSAAAYDQREVERAIASLRNHQGFHEQCVEDLYSRLENALLPAELHVVGFFQRRGGVDITPWRSSAALPPCLTRLYEQ